jgi:hypothetical protein
MVTSAQLVEAAKSARLDVIALTDHDTMESVKEAQARGEVAGVIVIAGQEVTTRAPAQTHILGWFLEKPIKRGMSIEDTVDAIHDQGGLAIIPHPFMPVYFGSIQPRMLGRLIERHKIDGIEMMATVPLGKRRRRELDEFYAANKDRLGAAIGASDCHFGMHDIAQAVTEYQGDFRTAVLNCDTTPLRLNARRSVPASLVVRQQWRSLVELPFRRFRGEL